MKLGAFILIFSWTTQNQGFFQAVILIWSLFFSFKHQIWTRYIKKVMFNFFILMGGNSLHTHKTINIFSEQITLLRWIFFFFKESKLSPIPTGRKGSSWYTVTIQHGDKDRLDMAYHCNSRCDWTAMWSWTKPQMAPRSQHTAARSLLPVKETIGSAKKHPVQYGHVKPRCQWN